MINQRPGGDQRITWMIIGICVLVPVFGGLSPRINSQELVSASTITHWQNVLLMMLIAFTLFRLGRFWRLW
jgi:hypothetical protein